MFNQNIFKQQLITMHQQAPLVHCMTNNVVINFTANVLLAIGASPAMVIAQEESAEFAKVASALLINLGTLTTPQKQAMQSAIESAHLHNVPWVLDPVAIGALKFRTDFCFDILQLRPTAIRGNASEILALVGKHGASKGPDSLVSSDEAIEAAITVARQYQTVVAITGVTDYVTDGNDLYALNNGHSQLTKVTGAGCSLSAMVAAYCACCDTPLLATLTALSHMAIAGELAAAETKAIGSFAVSLLDHLQLLAQQGGEQLRWQKL